MKAEINDGKGSTQTIEIEPISAESMQEFTRNRLSDDKLKSYLVNLDISADAKQLIDDLSKIVIKVGNHVIQFGKKIIEIVIMLVQKYPNTTFGLILGLIMTAIIATVPIVGWILSPLVGPLLLAVGLSLGYLEDLKDIGLKRKVAEISAHFSELKAK